MKKFERVVAAVGGSQILAVIENLPVSENGFFLNENQMDSIESALEASEANATALEAATASINAVTEQLATANTSLATATDQLSAKEQSLVEANAKIAALELLSGKASGTGAEEDPKREAAVDKTQYLNDYDRMPIR